MTNQSKQVEKVIERENKLGRKNIEVITSGGVVLVVTYRSKYSAHGYTVDEAGRAEFKTLKVQETKGGELYVMANRKRFNLSEAQAATVDIESIEKSIEEAEGTIRMYRRLFDDGEMTENVKTAIANQEFIISNLKNLLK